MKTLSEQIDEKFEKDKIAEEKADVDYDKQDRYIEKLIEKAVKEAVDVVGYRLEMRKQHEKMYYFSFNLSSEKRANKISSYIHNSDIFNNAWEFNKNSMTYFRSIKKIDIGNLKNELIILVEELILEMKIL